MPTVLLVHTEARALLNDIGNTLFSDTVLLPFTKKAYQELQDELANNGLQEVFEQDSTVNINAGVSAILGGGGAGQYPNDLIIPVTLWDKAQGAPDSEYVELDENTWEPDEVQKETLSVWRWEENEIKLLGATTARTVRIRYIKFMTALVDTNSNIAIINCQTYMAARVAAIAALVIGGNPNRAELYQADANRALTKLINTAVKRKQNTPSRRQPHRTQS